MGTRTFRAHFEHHRARAQRATALVATTLVLTAIFGEVGLRAIGFAEPDWYEYDARLGWRHRKNLSAWSRQEGEALVETNSHGFRDRERTYEKASSVLRVAVLGDSFTEAHQVSFEDMFTTKLEHELATCAGRAEKKIEVLNFGASSYGTTNEYVLLEDEVWKYAPDVVLLAFTTGNDIEDNEPALANAKARPYVRAFGDEITVDLSLNPPLSGAQRSWHALLPHSRLAQFAQRMRMLRAAKKSLATQGGNLVDVGLSDAIYSEPKTEEWRRAWSTTFSLLRAMNRSARKHGALFVVATLSNSVQVHPDAKLRRAFAEKLGVPDLFHVERELEKLGRENAFPVLALAPFLAEQATREQECLHGFSNTNPCAGHWNAKGHALASKRMAEGICRALSVR